ncbi:MAG: IctB family putative bicarbonate transporter [Synechococcales cyanobacterium]
MGSLFWQECWQTSVPGRLTGMIQAWGTGSWLVPWLEPLGLLLVMLYWGLSSQAGTGSLGLILLGVAAVVGAIWLTQPPVAPLLTGQGILLLYWGVATLATLVSPVRVAALDGWIKLTLYLLGFVLLHRLLQRPFYRHAIVGSLLLVSLGMAVVGWRQYFFGAAELATWVDPESGLTGVTRVYSTLLNPNLYGGFLVPLIPLGLAAVWQWRGWGLKVLAAGITLMNTVCIVLTLSRGAWVGLAAALVVMVVLLLQWMQPQFPVRWRRWVLPLVLGGGLAVLALGILTVEPLRLRVLSLFAGRNDSSNNFRINVWLASWRMLQDFPWLGIGPGNRAFNRVYPLYQDPLYSALGAYSVPLEMALEVGIPGMLLYFVGLVGWLLVKGWRAWRWCLAQRQSQGLWLAASLAALVGMVVHGLVDTVWYRPQIQMLWWLHVAMITAFWADLRLWALPRTTPTSDHHISENPNGG